MKLETLGGDDRFIMCHSGHYLEVEGSRRRVWRLLRKMMMIVASMKVKNGGGILDVFWNMGTGFADGYRLLKESRIMPSLAVGWMDLSFLT